MQCIASEDPKNIAGFLETVKEVLDGARLMDWDLDLKAQLALSFHNCVGYVTSIHTLLKWRTNLHSCLPLPARAIPKILLLIAVRLKIPLPVIVHSVWPFAMHPYVVLPETLALTPDDPQRFEGRAPT